MASTSIRFYSGPARPQPRLGDRRHTKKHGEQVRVPLVVRHGPHRGAWVVSGGRQRWEWVTPDEAYRQYPHLRPKTAPEAAAGAAVIDAILDSAERLGHRVVTR